MLRPILPLPDHLRANEAGTFTADSVIRRLPEIASGVLADNNLGQTEIDLVEGLIVEIGNGHIVPIDEPLAPDAADWERYVDGYEGMTWLDAPWFFVETYFYRRILSATGYSRHGSHRGVDPFALQKQTGLDRALGLAADLGERSGDVAMLMAASLWANRVDLSLWRAGEGGAESRTSEVLAGSADRLLVDDSSSAVAALEESGRSVHLVLDNSGAELVADLALAAEVLRRDGRVTLHAKPHPTFVSDATPQDIDETASVLLQARSAASHIGDAIVAARAAGTLEVRTHPFWVSPLPFWSLPSDLVDEFAAADLVVIKGDANYRRLLGDLHWDPTTPFTDIVRPMQPVVALRTAKSLVAAGIDPEVVAATQSADPDWMSNGEWGLIQFAAEID